MERDDEAVDHPGYRSWRMFHGLCLDRPAPEAGMIDHYLRLYQRAQEVGFLRESGAAVLLVAAVGRALLDGTRVFVGMSTLLDGLVFGLTCTLLVVVGARALQRTRRALEHRALARGIDTNTLTWIKAESLFASVRMPEVREYLQSVREQARPLRRAEAAVALERANGRPPLDDAGVRGFVRHLRAREGVLGRQITAATACLLALLLARLSDIEATMFVPAISLLGGWTLAGLLGSGLQFLLDPWDLRAGGDEWRRVRAMLGADIVPDLAVVLVVFATATQLLGAA
jgi:hypothetical protein